MLLECNNLRLIFAIDRIGSSKRREKCGVH